MVRKTHYSRNNVDESDLLINREKRIKIVEFAGWLLFTLVYAIVMGIFLYYVYHKLPEESTIFGFGIFVRDAARVFVFAVWGVISAGIYVSLKNKR